MHGEKEHWNGLNSRIFRQEKEKKIKLYQFTLTDKDSYIHRYSSQFYLLYPILYYKIFTHFYYNICFIILEKLNKRSMLDIIANEVMIFLYIFLLVIFTQPSYISIFVL